MFEKMPTWDELEKKCENKIRASSYEFNLRKKYSKRVKSFDPNFIEKIKQILRGVRMGGKHYWMDEERVDNAFQNLINGHGEGHQLVEINTVSYFSKFLFYDHELINELFIPVLVCPTLGHCYLWLINPNLTFVE